ncbi:MAG: hypothetical protein HC809_07580 [Gammaproteobacteria bacterium]|nr:hypothetical protein [Gammaproteobacteria bacterium]
MILGGVLAATALVVALTGSMAEATTDCVDLSGRDAQALAEFRFTEVTSSAAETLSAKHDYRVGVLRIVRQPIFDRANPKENAWLYRAADAVHADTRESVIRDVISFSEGGRVRVADLIESERILRAKPYLYDARVLPRRLCADTLDVDVVTRDVWTLNPRLDFPDRAATTATESVCRMQTSWGRGASCRRGIPPMKTARAWMCSTTIPTWLTLASR